MSKVIVKDFTIIGVSVRTTNENGKSAKDIEALWNKFITEGILDRIPNKLDNTVYSIYTDYESDYTKPYSTIIGCEVKNTDTIPNGMIAKTITGGNYTKFVAKGDLTKGAVYEEWLKIWNTNLNRSYTADFEVYGKKTENPKDAEVNIFIATN